MRRITFNFLIFIFLILIANIARAQYSDTDAQGEKHFMVDAVIGLNTDGYETELGFSWWPVRGFGLKLAIGLAGELREMDDWYDYYYSAAPAPAQSRYYDDYYDDYYYYDDGCYASRFKFMPSIQLRSPTLIDWSSQSTTFHLFANPGLCLSPGARGSHDPQWFTWQLRGGIEADIGEEVMIALGYGYSNFNLYSGNPDCYYADDYKYYRTIHTVYFSIGYRF